MTKYVSVAAAAVLAAGMAGCGSAPGGGGSSATAYTDYTGVSKNAITGVFVDSVVQGAAYTCAPSGQTGTTTAAGKFECQDTDTSATFKVGPVTLGTITPLTQGKVVTPYSFFPNDNTASQRVAQFLQTFDNDGDPSNGINLVDVTGIVLPAFTDPAFGTQLQTQHTTLNIAGTVYKTIDEAREHMDGELGNSAPEIPDYVGQVTDYPGTTTFKQTVSVQDGRQPSFPGQANYWDMDRNIEVNDGYEDQFDDAMRLRVNGSTFPSMDYEDLTYYTPLFGTSDGVVAATTYGEDGWSGPIGGNYSAILNTGRHIKMQQTIDLTNAVAPIAFAWNQSVNLQTNAYDHDTSFKIKVLDTDGNLLTTLYSQEGGGPEAPAVPRGIPMLPTLNDYAGQKVVLSFESDNDGNGWVKLDNISVKDAEMTEFVTNGTFEGNNLTGWTIPDPKVSQNFTTAQQTMSSLKVSRSFYTKPNSYWGRYADTFENPTGSAITVDLEYYTNLGSDYEGIIYYTPGTNNKALTTWDGSGEWGDRDIGFVFGSMDSVDFESDTGLGDDNGDDAIYFGKQITVPANSRATIVNYVVMNGYHTGKSATSINDKATEMDTEVKRIITGVANGDTEFKRGLTKEQFDSIENF